ncbi:hypothetical protein DP73_01855 [Desulfosporosinus sp. HMP52]|uniref:hypothetical protein n=1 Tax=Desulfosporosinus sp. HMP52 TaxID=1487923 RepID=UPI00051FC2FF|nr:hypothetical protein [Desulfosporosinus sp. HMP52]KGK91797.1 hypothetical protein DP73_01855 [Desulfosporosinus sp. HMP52]
MKKHIILGVLLGFGLSLIIRDPFLSVTGYINKNILKHNLNNQLVVDLSESTKVMETPIIESGQLLYSAYLNDQTILIRGYIQIWNLDDLENFLVNSKRISTFDFHSYSLQPIKIANDKGYLTEWTASFGESYRISGLEYWLKKSDTSGVLRISFFTDTTSFSKEQMGYIEKIINSIIWSKYDNAI